jgi:hypothetical protein
LLNRSLSKKTWKISTRLYKVPRSSKTGERRMSTL